ncbi:hypothetical protein [Halomonas nitroreducens]|uniref:Uncharacterized protein n=1 Tax=Halomonas nitroreducens TaxID=447425 RepID=A0A3S0JVD0_9GAMM|nr:hypothetical protein [Halomonas nitroreducens]RTR01951.1 hypothetical protein EKG36_13160 [Halomonas nitroreducens]
MDKDLEKQQKQFEQFRSQIRITLPQWQVDLKKNLSAIQEKMRPLKEASAQIPDMFHEIQASISPIVERFQEIASQIPEDLDTFELQQKERIELLAENGWFPDFELSLGEHFQQAKEYQTIFHSEGANAADNYMTKHFEEVMNDFSTTKPKEVTDDRMKIILEAIGAHASGKYFLSAPIFLMQADGYSKENHGHPVWSPGKGGTSLLTAARENNNEENYLSALLLPMLSTKMPVIVSTRNRPEIKIPDHIINRNLVLHGESIRYGTRENSARAFAFMWYCMFFMHTFFRDK